MKRSTLWIGIVCILSLFSLMSVFFGCGDTVVPDIQDMVVKITPSASQCIEPGGSVDFSSHMDPRGTAPYVYNWDFGDSGVAASDMEDPGEVVFPNKGNFTVTLTVTDSAERQSTDVVYIRVKDNCDDEVVATIVLPPSDITISVGATLPFEGTGSGGDTPYTYHWYFEGPDSTTSQEQNPSRLFSQEGTWDVLLVVHDAIEDKGSDRVTVTVEAGSGWIGSHVPPFTAPDGVSITGSQFGSSSGAGMMMFYGTGGMVGFDIGTETWTGNLLPSYYNVLSAVTLTGQSDAGPNSPREQRDYMFFYTNTDAHVTYWNPDIDAFGMVLFLPGQIVRDAVPYNDDPTAGGFVYTQPTAVRIVDFDSSSGFFQTSLSFYNGHFPGWSGNLISAFTRDATGAFVTVTDASPGQLYVSTREAGSATLVGEIGDTPRQIRCLDELCVISCFDSDELWIATWDQSDIVTIVGSVTVGDGPIGIDLLGLDGGQVAVVSTGFLDHTYTITVLDAAGAVVSSTTLDAPTDCSSPPHAVWGECPIVS